MFTVVFTTPYRNYFRFFPLPISFLDGYTTVCTQVVAIPHPRYHAVAYATAIEALKEKLQLMEGSTATTGFRDKITKAWQAVRDAGTTMIPAKVTEGYGRQADR